MTDGLCIGVDVGSVSVNLYVTDKDRNLLLNRYHRTNGLPFQKTLEALKELFKEFPDQPVLHLALTGSGGKELTGLIGGEFVNEIVAQSRAVAQEIPEARTVIEMGGEDSKLLIFAEEDGRCVLKDFSMNALCAAGTGSFLDQQATRLGVSIEKEFGEMALKCEHAPRIAGRCSVFAKSDMIHLQQVGTPIEDIVSGLCHALARNFKATIGKGKTLHKPIAFQGGVAANIGMVSAFENVLGLNNGELIVPEHHASMGAIGALLIAMDNGTGGDFAGLVPLEQHIAKPYQLNTKLESLCDALTDKGNPESKIYSPEQISEDKKPIDAYLGIDVGSISTNVVVIDSEHRVLSKRYLPTASRPIEAIGKGLDGVYEDLGDSIVIRAAGTTGSGRYLSGDIIGADVVVNEITAQATAAIDIDPEVDTIFEIGGQDSKFISVDKSAIVDFEMNKVCAAGTGSFLEEQAERLGIDLKTEFASLALGASNPVPLGDRCTVFMETDLVHHQQAGADKSDLLSGLAYSTVYNYLNRVVADKRIGKRIFFQGGTAFNKSVVAAFNKVLGHEVTVPPHHEVTGAIGVATIAHRRQGNKPSKFKGFDLSKRKFKLKTFECKSCENRCEIHSISMDGEKPLFYGSRCEKYDVDHGKKKNIDLPDLFEERYQQLTSRVQSNPENPLGRVGIPLASAFHEQLPFWTAFFQSLGYAVELSGNSNKPLINRGVEAVVAECCFPVKVAHGHIMALFERDLDFLFVPSIIDSPSPGYAKKDKSCFNCPYIQTIPYITDAAIGYKKQKTPVLTPALFMQLGRKAIIREMVKLKDELKVTKSDIQNAVDQGFNSQNSFNQFLKKRGHEILDNLPEDQKAIVIVGRPYNTCDSGVNLGIPKKLLGMNILPIPMDMIPLDEIDLSSSWGHMYWRYGQRILKAASFIREHHHVYALYVTNFGCGPDSFLLKFFSRELGDKPFLQIEIDEHSADAGAITRCEAYLDTIAAYNGTVPRKQEDGPILALGTQPGNLTVYIPHMNEHAYVLESVFRAEGMNGQVMDPPDEESLYWGNKYTTGKECFPAILTSGDLVRQTKRPDFDPENSAFFMPSANGPCRFGQYATLHRHTLDSIGLPNIPIVSLDQDVDYHKDTKALSLAGLKAVWAGINAVDALERYRLSIRPYEVNRGDTESVFCEAMEEIKSRLVNKKNILPVLDKYSSIFRQIPVTGKGSRPLIGIVGEIYIRSNPSGNENLIAELESMGAEVYLPPIAEWMDYSTLMRKRRNMMRGNYVNGIKDFVIERYMHNLERKIAETAGLEPEPYAHDLLDMARPYLHDSFAGEAILSVGKTLEFIMDSGASGVINVMPFTCMPGTIVTAILKQIHEDFDGFPCLSLAFAGQQSLNMRLRLEAFMYQATDNWKRRNKSVTADK